MPFKGQLASIILTVLSLSLFSCSAPVQTLSYKINKVTSPIYASAQAQGVDMESMIEYLKNTPVIFVGDIHDNNATHQFLNQLITTLSNKGYRIHLANEWFSPSDNQTLARYVNSEINSSAMMSDTNFSKRIYFDENLSLPLYKSVKLHGGVLYGINMSSKMRKKISLKLEQNMSNEEFNFYSALELDVQTHKDLVSPYFAHCELYKSKSVEACKARMYRVQVAWDSYMAKESVKLSKEVLKSPKDKLVVFAGEMHMNYGLGIPLRFARLSPLDFKIITNYKQNDNLSMIPLGLADFIYLY